MGASKAQRAKTAERRRRAIELRLAGATYEQIAETLGYSSRAAAYVDIDRALRAALAEQHQEADMLRHQELARIDTLQRSVWDAAMQGDLRAVDVALRCIDRRCRLLGLDAPQRVEAAMVRYEIVGVDPADLA